MKRVEQKEDDEVVLEVVLVWQIIFETRTFHMCVIRAFTHATRSVNPCNTSA